jgi:hypothetical protein
MSYKKGDYLILFASKLAACAGMHRYVPQETLRSEFLRSQGLLEGYVTQMEQATAAIEALPDQARARVHSAVAACYPDAAAANAALASLSSSVDLQPEVLSAVRSQVYTKHGQEQEDVVRRAAAERSGKRARTSAAFRTCEYPVLNVRGVEVYVGGRHDGTLDGELVEIKTRQNRFLGTPDYELVQLHAYMHIYGKSSATLVESFNGDIREHKVPFDTDLWGRVISSTAAFLEDLLDAAGEPCRF